MGYKYNVMAFDFPLKGYKKTIQTDWMVVALWYFIKWSGQYDGVDIVKRDDN